MNSTDDASWAELDEMLRQRGVAEGTAASLGPLRAEYAGGLSGVEWGLFVFGGSLAALAGVVVFGYGVAVGDALDLYAFGPLMLLVGAGLVLRPRVLPQRWWVGAFEEGLVGVHERRDASVHRWDELDRAEYLRIEKYVNFAHTETSHHLRVFPKRGTILEFRRNDSVSLPPRVRLGDFAAVVVEQLASLDARRILVGVRDGKTARRSEPIDVVIAPDGLTWGRQTYPWAALGGLRGYTADTWNKGEVEILRAGGGRPVGYFRLGKGMSSEKIGVCLAIDTLARAAR